MGFCLFVHELLRQIAIEPLEVRVEQFNGSKKAAHGKSRRAPVAARFSFIAFLNSATSSSASRSFSGSVVESSAFQAARSSSVAVSMEPIGGGGDALAG